MTITRSQIFRSNVAGNRPTVGARQPGELYVNWPELQLGTINAAQAPLDLLAIRFFSSTSTYAAGDMVRQAGQLYIANGAITAGAFNATQWNKVALISDLTAGYLPLVGGTLTGNLNITPSAAGASLYLNASAGQSTLINLNKATAGVGIANNIIGQTGGKNRWMMAFGDSTAESGSNIGSDFSIYRADDSGALVDIPLNIQRSTGIVTIASGGFQTRGPGSGIFCYDQGGSGGNTATWFGFFRTGNQGVIQMGDGAAKPITIDGAGTVHMQGGFYTDSTTSFCSNNVTITGAAGIFYNGVNSHYGYTNNAIGFGWSGSQIYASVDNAASFPLTGTSDERLKQDIAPSKLDCLAALDKIELFEFRYKDLTDLSKPKPAKSDAMKHPVGFVAQRLHKVFPEAVIAGTETKEDGSFAAWTPNDRTLIATAIGAIQQLTKQVSTLTARVAELESVK